MYLPQQFANQVIPNNKLAPNLVKKGIRTFASFATRIDV